MKQIKDYTYCDSTHCIHRRGCLRHYDFQQGNFKKCNFLVYDVNCMERYFKYLVRFRYSDGSEFKND